MSLALLGGLTVGVPACGFNTDGESGSGAELAPSAEGSGTGDDPDTVGPPSTTRESGAMTSGQMSSGSDDDESSGTGPEDPTTGPVDLEGAFLSFSVQSAEFPVQADVSTGTYEVTVFNEGGRPATSIQAEGLGDTFHFSSGYPGDGGSCGTTIEPDSSCTIVIAATPLSIGRWEAQLVLRYQDESNGRATPPLQLGLPVHGVTSNLIMNPSGAAGDLVGWDGVGGLWVADQDSTSSDDGFSFRPTGASDFTGARSLRQTIHLGATGAASAVDPLRFQVNLHAKRTGSASAYSARIRQGAGEWIDLGGGVSPSWQEIAEDQTLAPGAVNSLDIELVCIGVALSGCGTRFDQISVVLAYP